MLYYVHNETKEVVDWLDLLGKDVKAYTLVHARAKDLAIVKATLRHTPKPKDKDWASATTDTERKILAARKAPAGEPAKSAAKLLTLIGGWLAKSRGRNSKYVAASREEMAEAFALADYISTELDGQ